MKRSIWSAYALSAPAPPLLYQIIILFIPKVTNQDEFSAITWIVSSMFFVGISYIACLIFGGPLIFLLRRIHKFTFWWVVVPGSTLYSVALYLTFFVVMGAEIIAHKFYVISTFLFAGFGLGIIVTTLFCFLAGITRRPSRRNEPGSLA